MPDNSPSNPIEDLEAKLTGLAAEHSRIEDWNQAQDCWSGTHRAGEAWAIDFAGSSGDDPGRER
jgi:hypothetical protein